MPLMLKVNVGLCGLWSVHGKRLLRKNELIWVIGESPHGKLVESANLPLPQPCAQSHGDLGNDSPLRYLTQGSTMYGTSG